MNDCLPVRYHENHLLVTRQWFPWLESKVQEQEQVLKKTRKFQCLSLLFPGPASQRSRQPAAAHSRIDSRPSSTSREPSRPPTQCRPSSRRQQFTPHGQALSSRITYSLVRPRPDTYGLKMHSQTLLLRTSSRALAAH